MKLTMPISYPIAKVLDSILGEHKITRYNASQLAAIIEIHSMKSLDLIKGHIETKEFGRNGTVGLNKDQTKMIKGVLVDWRTTTANQVYKKVAKVYMLSCERVVNEDLMKEIKKKNYSRIPVYYGDIDRKLVIGILLVKSLVGLQLEEGVTIQDLIAKK
jgi:metal transporter CNNM